MVVLWGVDSRGLPPPSCVTCHFPGLGLSGPVPEGGEDSSRRSQQRYPAVPVRRAAPGRAEKSTECPWGFPPAGACHTEGWGRGELPSLIPREPSSPAPSHSPPPQPLRSASTAGAASSSLWKCTGAPGGAGGLRAACRGHAASPLWRLLRPPGSHEVTCGQQVSDDGDPQAPSPGSSPRTP